MTREDRIRDDLIKILDNLDESDMLDVYRNYCDETNGFDNEIYWNDEEELDMVFNEQSPYYVLCRAYYGEYRLSDRFFTFNGYGNLRSFNSLDDDNSPIYTYEIAEWCIDNDNDLENDEIREYLDSVGDFEESVRRPRRINKESIRRNRRRYRK